MASSSGDPRGLTGGVAAAAAAVVVPKASILLGGEDEMDVDEDLPLVDDSNSNNNLISGGAGSDKKKKQLGGGSGAGGEGPHLGFSLLLDQIITPSPYPQHNAGSTSSRFRNALNRVLQQPDTDVEAWQALLTEVNSCYKNIPNVHAVDMETQAKLDWVESCYGHFLRYFPYSYTHAIVLVKILLRQSARWGEPDGPLVDYYGGGILGKVSKRAQLCESKLEALFQEWLGISNMEGEMAPMKPPPAAAASAASDDAAAKAITKPLPEKKPFHLTGICSWVVELWLLYIQKRSRDATRAAMESLPPEQRQTHIRQATKQAYEVALPHCGFSHNNHLFWTSYLDFCKSWTNNYQELTAGTAEHAAVTQQQMLALRSVYQRLVTHPMTGLDQLWQEYEAWERSQSEALAQALSTEFAPKYQHARTVYLERNRVYNASVDLQLGGQRLATPPTNWGDEDYDAKMDEEHRILTAWKKRCSYERTNPERLSPSDLIQRIRAAYKEMACVLTRHVETWHMWSTYELLCQGPANPAPAEARSVLQLGQEWIPDSTLLVYSEARIVELYTTHREECMTVMQKSLQRFPTTLAYTLYQQMVRRYKGMDEARVVFRKARRVLVDPDAAQKTKLKSGGVDGALKASASEADNEDENPEKSAIMESKITIAGDMDGKNNRWMVTNLLDPWIGAAGPVSNGSRGGGGGVIATAGRRNVVNHDEDNTHNGGASVVVIPGPITWHLYAAHAAMEHRINRCPQVAARVYELGLRKHTSFLTKASYVLRYAEILLELGDTMNLRALLTRALSACEAVKGKHDSALAALWDMTLRFETILCGADPDSLANLETIERQRHQAIMGSENEDVATGALVGAVDTPLIGPQKSSIAEHLIRTEGYDVSSGIVNGLSRSVDVLEVMGLWGSGGIRGTRNRTPHGSEFKHEENDDIPGGSSDLNYHRRLDFATLAASGGATEGGAAEGGSRLMTARERLQQGSGGAVVGPAGPSTAIMLAIQQMPEWLKPLLLLLPASRLRLPIVGKPPLHLTEIALTTLRQNPLPMERPRDDQTGGSKRKMDAEGDSSDEDNDGKSSGYSIAFRQRQRARMNNAGQQNGAN